jgi:hypothetical protein
MAVRTTEVAVQGIVEHDATITLTPFIEVASSIVDDVCADDSDYDATKLELIERWLSAHFYHIRDKAVASEKAGSVAQNFQYKLGLMFASTMYGQMAMTVDHKGHLAALSKRAEKGSRASASAFIHLGTVDADGNDISE